MLIGCLLERFFVTLRYKINKYSNKKQASMATKKNYRANNTRLIEGGNGDNPKLMAQILQDGRESLYLEYY